MNGTRHYGMDWLRIGAFALLIFYHIGMYFVPWGWHVKIAQPRDWVQIPMMATLHCRRVRPTLARSSRRTSTTSVSATRCATGSR